MRNQRSGSLNRDLEYDTLTNAESGYLSGGGKPGDPPNPCHWCVGGDHQKCTGVDCYRCPSEFHPRLPGISVTMEHATNKTVGR